MSGKLLLGPGSLRVGRFIGRLGVVTLRAVEAGLDLDQRVVRRHVAKLESAGWLGRAPWVWGEGSVAWLTHAGIERAGLGGLRAVKAPPAATTIAHGVAVGWTAARVERRGRMWKSTRELALEPERWAVAMRCERGYTEQLPDLAVWLRSSGPPIAVIAESGGRREDRQKMILEGWASAIIDGCYAAVLYDCANASVARWINRLAEKARIAGPAFTAAVQMGADEIAGLSPANGGQEAAFGDPTETETPRDLQGQVRPAVTPASRTAAQLELACTTRAREPETPEAAAERERLYRQIMGLPEPKPRRRWRG